MKVTAICFGSFRDHLPPEVEDNKVVLEVDQGSTVGDVTDRLGSTPSSWTDGAQISPKPSMKGRR
jgi:hypothetical protein